MQEQTALGVAPNYTDLSTDEKIANVSEYLRVKFGDFGGSVPYQGVSIETYGKKYQLTDLEGNLVDQDMFDTAARTAVALSEVEGDQQENWAIMFAEAILAGGAYPAGRIASNAGAEAYKPRTSLINCTVSRKIPDSMDGIFSVNRDAALTLQAGCGIGYAFSGLRPSGAMVGGAGASTNGPLAFMDVFDTMCGTVSSAGGRRGAQMATFDVAHPDIFEYIKAKREDGRLRKFNMSLLIPEDFMEAKNKDGDWDLVFPMKEREVKTTVSELILAHKAVWRYWPDLLDDGSYVKNDAGEYLCKVYKTVKATELWEAMMQSTYDFAEPGVVFVDAYNRFNNNWFCEVIRTTNPCGEQGLPEDGACLLGSINLVKHVANGFTENATFNWDTFSETVRIFARMLDNVVELANLPLEAQQAEIERKRRHGMGYLGLGSAMAMLGIDYGSPESVEFTDKVTKILAIENFRAGAELAQEKGMAPVLMETFELTPELIARNDNIRKQIENGSLEIGQNISGHELWLNSHYFDAWKSDPDAMSVFEELEQLGSRFTHASSIAPTGTIALTFGNNVSNGIEPSFSHHYVRNIIQEGKKTKSAQDVFSYELLAYREMINPDAMPDSWDENGNVVNNGLPEKGFITAEGITPEQHAMVQGAAQKWIDSSISKTCNVPTDYPYDDFKDAYDHAYKLGLKGFTTFRFNPDTLQGVLVNKSDLANTVYVFNLDDGSSLEVVGGETMVMYDGEEHTAANLYDAIKEGQYGKF